MTPSQIGQSIIAFAPAEGPSSAARILRSIIGASIDGLGPLLGAKQVAADSMEEKGDVEAAIDSLITSHIVTAGAQGLMTNVGGIATAILGIPANMGALAILHARLSASIAHLRGYDLNDPRTRHAIVATLLGKKIVDDLVCSGKLPGTPLVLATAPIADPSLELIIAQRVLTALFTSSGGKQAIGLIAKRIPLLGGGVAMVTDGWNTRAIGTYAKEQFISRRIVTR